MPRKCVTGTRWSSRPTATVRRRSKSVSRAGAWESGARTADSRRPDGDCRRRFGRYTARVMSDTSIPEAALTTFLDALDKANQRVAEQFPGDGPARQPVHTVYGGAHLFKADAAQKLGSLALRALQEHAPDEATLAGVVQLDGGLAGLR